MRLPVLRCGHQDHPGSGAHASANLYSLVETAKANGIDPYLYLQSMLKTLPYAQTADDYEKLLPWNVTASEELV